MSSTIEICLSLQIVESSTGLGACESDGAKGGEVGDTLGITNGSDTLLDNSKNFIGVDIVLLFVCEFAFKELFSEVINLFFDRYFSSVLK